MTTSLAAWKTFLQGRIAQEEGRDQDAVNAFQNALQDDPENPYFLNALAFAYKRLNRPTEALSAKLASQYGDLAKRYVGDADKPDQWIAGLRSLLGDVEQLETNRTADAVGVVW